MEKSLSQSVQSHIIRAAAAACDSLMKYCVAALISHAHTHTEGRAAHVSHSHVWYIVAYISIQFGFLFIIWSEGSETWGKHAEYFVTLPSILKNVLIQMVMTQVRPC